MPLCVNIDDGSVEVDPPIRQPPTAENVGNPSAVGTPYRHLSISNKFLGFAATNGQQYNGFPNNIPAPIKAASSKRGCEVVLIGRLNREAATTRSKIQLVDLEPTLGVRLVAHGI